MGEKSNSDVISHVMNSLFTVISSRTTPAHAWLTLRILIQKVTYNYNFLNSVELIDIDDIKEMEYYKKKMTNIVNVDKIVIEAIHERIIGEAIQALADQIKRYLGKKAGYHLLREFREELGEEYYRILNEMGVDLRLVELQNELYGWITKGDAFTEEDLGMAIAKND